MHARTAALALFFLAPVGTAFASVTPYEAARALGREDATDPLYQAWYLGQMRPAFIPVFRAGMERCASLARGKELTTLGFVFGVQEDGTVGQFVASRDTRFARCLEGVIRGQTYPPAPKDPFHFGLDLAPHR